MKVSPEELNPDVNVYNAVPVDKRVTCDLALRSLVSAESIHVPVFASTRSVF
jgi:hypothetical protein